MSIIHSFFYFTHLHYSFHFHSSIIPYDVIFPSFLDYKLHSHLHYCFLNFDMTISFIPLKLELLCNSVILMYIYLKINLYLFEPNFLHSWPHCFIYIKEQVVSPTLIQCTVIQYMQRLRLRNTEILYILQIQC